MSPPISWFLPMSVEVARSLYRSAQSHALSGNLLYNAALAEALGENHHDPEASVFNGTYSLSIHYLIGLSLELYLKSAYVLRGGAADERSLRAIGHDLVGAQRCRESGLFLPSAQSPSDSRTFE
jgi:hypothetical protein